MDFFTIIPIVIFLLGYVLITLEHKLPAHKSAIALALAAILWILASLQLNDKAKISHALHDAGAEVFGIVVFLLAAMSLVEILNHYQFFNFIKTKLIQLKFSDKKQFIVISWLTFFLSAVLDNLTVTIVMTQIACRFFKLPNLLVVTAGIVIAANAGGAFSPIGDVTTIMIWLAGKFTAMEIISQIFLPSFVLTLVSSLLLVRQLKDTDADVSELQTVRLSRGEKIVIGVCLLSFSFPLFMNGLGLQPYLGLLLGLGVVWQLIEYAKRRSRNTTHLEANIEKLIQNTDIASLKFFIGILLAVSALGTMGLLDSLSHFVFGPEQELNRVIIGNIFLGAFSAVIDNVPLTAIALDLIHITDPSVWTLLAYCVGTGGSMLLIGSVAGVVAGGIVKELTFGKYLKIATIPAAVGYIAGILVWFLQRGLIN